MDVTKLGSRKKQLINYDPLLGDTEISTVVARRLQATVSLAQLIEHRLDKPEVVGLSPTRHTMQ